MDILSTAITTTFFELPTLINLTDTQSEPNHSMSSLNNPENLHYMLTGRILLFFSPSIAGSMIVGWRGRELRFDSLVAHALLCCGASPASAELNALNAKLLIAGRRVTST